jgi:outer membrane protein assembly factor BamB
LIDQDVVYVGLASGKVVALNMSDGTPVWSQQVAIPKGTSDLDRMVDIDNNLIIDQGGLFAATYQGTVAVMSATQGQLFWGRDISTYTPMSNYSNALFIASADGDVTAVNEQDGTFTWTQKALHGRHLIGTVIQAGHVVTGDDEGWLYWLDPANGHLLARYHATGGFAGMPCVFDDTLYAQGVKGDVLALRVVSKPE